MNKKAIENRYATKHQIYTPLTIIKGYISLFQEKTYGDISSDMRNALEIMDTNVDSLTNQIEKLDL